MQGVAEQGSSHHFAPTLSWHSVSIFQRRKLHNCYITTRLSEMVVDNPARFGEGERENGALHQPIRESLPSSLLYEERSNSSALPSGHSSASIHPQWWSPDAGSPSSIRGLFDYSLRPRPVEDSSPYHGTQEVLIRQLFRRQEGTDCPRFHQQ